MPSSVLADEITGSMCGAGALHRGVHCRRLCSFGLRPHLPAASCWGERLAGFLPLAARDDGQVAETLVPRYPVRFVWLPARR